jgi:hypothetical protein
MDGQKTVAVWIHDLQFSDFDLVVNETLFKDLKTKDVRIFLVEICLFQIFIDRFFFFF